MIDLSYQRQHTLTLTDRSAAAEKSDDHDDRSNADEDVRADGQISECRRLIEKLSKRRIRMLVEALRIDLDPDSDAENGASEELNQTTAGTARVTTSPK